MSRIPRLPEGYRLHRYSKYPEGRYQLIECIASGGFGITYRAFDPKHQCEVVIKELCMECYMKRSPGNVSFEPLSNRDGDEVQVFDRVRRRFYREAKVLNGLRHHNIVRVVKFFGENNTYYYVMEPVRGKNLHDLYLRKDHEYEVADGTQLLQILRSVLWALAYMESFKLVHGDIKPSNIMRRLEPAEAGAKPKPGEIKLIDFGSVEQAGTRPEFKTGTPAYTPEFLGSLGSVDYRLDIYALGLTMRQLVENEAKPAKAPWAAPLANNVAYVGKFGKELLETIDRATSRESESVWQDAQAWLEALSGLESTLPPPPRPPQTTPTTTTTTPPPPPTPPSPSPKTLIWVLVGLCMLLVLTIILLLN